ncbi:hypothetical protein [Kamptonema formosum]|nr:hypothetical protein [Oscillatoria sp. PCC 10802]
MRYDSRQVNRTVPAEVPGFANLTAVGGVLQPAGALNMQLLWEEGG